MVVHPLLEGEHTSRDDIRVSEHHLTLGLGEYCLIGWRHPWLGLLATIEFSLVARYIIRVDELRNMVTIPREDWKHIDTGKALEQFNGN